MTHETPQMAEWGGDFGKKYTDRNILNANELDALYMRQLGVSRRAMNEQFIGELDRNLKILEVGSNVGNQLLCLQEMGFKDLFGIELQSYAVALSKKLTQGICIIQGSAFALPFGDEYFDLVFTSGVLIHLAPGDIHLALREIHRCSRRFVWGMEYYAREYQSVAYRGHDELLWKGDFASLYLETCPDLIPVKRQTFPWLEGSNEDAMFLLAKRDRTDSLDEPRHDGVT